jgi:CHAT domain
MKRVLILASNPRNDLNLRQEIRSLTQAIDRSQHRDQIEIHQDPAVRPEDLQRLLVKYKPHIVHFCGHAIGEGLILENESGKEQVVSSEALAKLFSLFPQTECVLLNSCYTEQQAEKIVEHVQFVIGMQQDIKDSSAIAFSQGFYTGLGAGRSIEQSYHFGCNAIQLVQSSTSEAQMNEAFRKLEQTENIKPSSLPEHLQPIFKQNIQLQERLLPLAPPPQPPMKEFIVREIEIIQKDIASAERREKYLTEEFDAIADDIKCAPAGSIERKLGLSQKKVEQDREDARTRLRQLYTKLEELRSQLQ